MIKIRDKSPGSFSFLRCSFQVLQFGDGKLDKDVIMLAVYFMRKITVNMLSIADSVKGQGVETAYNELIALLKKYGKDDLEIVAVIAAAIAAAEADLGPSSGDGYVVRSIRKVSSRNQWKRG